VWAREKNGTCWYRQNITDTYPEGTAWQSQQFQVASLSVGPNNQVWMINRNSIQRRYKVTATHPLGRGWEVILSECWRWISVRAAIGPEEDVDEAEDIVKIECPVSGPNSLLAALDLSEVDIYSMYGQNDTVETPDSEIEEEELLQGTKMQMATTAKRKF